MNQRVRILIADDHVLVRKGILALLATEHDIEVIGEAANGQDAITQSALLTPDVILMDLEMPGVDGITAIQRIMEQRHSIRILVLTSFTTDDKVFPAIKVGATGYLLKDSSPGDLIQAIHRVYQGESSLHPVIARRILRELANPPKAPPTTDPLTPRELEILRLLARGLSNQAMAEELTISEATVRTHISTILSKLQLASRTQAALYALRQGIASLDDPSS